MAINPYSIPPFISSILILSLGIFVFSKSRKSPTNISFLFLSLSLFIWLFSDALLYSNTTYGKALFWGKTVYIGVTAIPLAALCLIKSLLKFRFKDFKIIIEILLVFYLITVLLVFNSKLIINGLYKYHYGYYPKAGHLHFLYLIAWLLVYIYAIYLSYTSGYKNKFNKYSLDECNRIKYGFWILMFGGIGVIDFMGKYGLEFYPPGYIIIPMFLITTAYSIVKHQIMDINIAIRKGLVYPILITVFTVIYLSIVILTERFFQGILGYKSLLISILFASIIALIFIPLKNKIQSFIDKVFLGKTPEQIAQENELLKQELMRSEKLKAVAAFASGMAHEIKNPLTSLKTFTEFLPQKVSDKQFLLHFGGIISLEVDKINDLVRQLLDFSKPSAPELKEVDMHKLIDDTLELLSSELLKHNIKVIKKYNTNIHELHTNGHELICEDSCAIRDNSCLIRVDSQQMKQVFLNLFLNSIEAMPHGGTLTVSTHLRPSGEKESVLICVQDTGSGISDRNIPHIFEPFYTTKEKGSGLGLSIVYNIIKEHNGKISVESKINKGTKFIIELPKE